jgi:SAM-dependent methyltransferase
VTDNAAPWRLMAMADGYLTTQLLYVAARLGLADELAAGPRTGADVAAAVGADPDSVTRVLRGLSLEDVFVEDDDGRFALGPLGEHLRDGVPGSLRGAVLVRGAVYYSATGDLLHATRTGSAAFERVYGRPFFDHLDRDPEAAAVFQASMAGRADHEAAAVLAAYDLSGYSRLVDIGAGPGVTTRAALRALPGLRATLFDRPGMLERARTELTDAGLAERCTFVEGDFFDAVPAGGDVYLLSRVLHDWVDDDAVRILKSCRAAMPPGARLLIVDAVLPTRARDLPAAIRMDLMMLILLGARERTEEEFRRVLSSAGFEFRRVVPTGSPTGLAIVECELPNHVMPVPSSR